MNEQTLRQLADTAHAAGERLWRAGSERRATWLASAFASLGDERGALFEPLLTEVPASTGLSREMVAWAAAGALTPLTAEALRRIDRAAQPPNPRAIRVRGAGLCVVVLAGNVFTAAARAVMLPLLFGVPVLAKSAGLDAAFVQLLQRALHQADPELGPAFQVACFSSREEALVPALFERADLVSVYGSDETLNAVRARLPARVPFLAHGHGLGAAFVDALALQDERAAQRAAEALALDVAAYDQRGCMSPLVGWVRSGQPVTPERFAELLHGALSALSRSLPRGPLPVDVASAQLGFRGIAAMQGLLLEGERHAVAYAPDAPLHIPPGYRNLQLSCVADLPALCARLAPLGEHLKCLGVTGLDREAVAALRSLLPAPLAPRICALGTMQLPPVDAVHDGLPAWEGLQRYAELDL